MAILVMLHQHTRSIAAAPPSKAVARGGLRAFLLGAATSRQRFDLGPHAMRMAGIVVAGQSETIEVEFGVETRVLLLPRFHLPPNLPVEPRKLLLVGLFRRLEIQRVKR